MHKLFFTPAEAAAALGIGRTKLFELLATGALTRRRLGARTLIAADDLQRFAESLPVADRAASVAGKAGANG